MTNERERQTYYGAMNLLTKTVHLQERPVGDGASTVAYLAVVSNALSRQAVTRAVGWGELSSGASTMQTFLAQENAGLAEAEWKVTCLLFAPNAPEQNPIGRLVVQREDLSAQAVCRQ